MSELTSLYLHGLGGDTLRAGEEAILERHRRVGINAVAAYLNWRSKETALQVRDRIAEQANNLLSPMSASGQLILEGASAGVWLAIAVAKLLDDSRVTVIGHSGRIRSGNLVRWDPRTLERCAHLGTDEASQSFYDGVLYCENEVIPRLTKSQKSNTLLTVPFAGIDEIVPASTMPIEGVRTVTMPAIGHVWAIAHGMYRMPSLVQKVPNRLQ